jgi:hypothetical protein
LNINIYIIGVKGCFVKKGKKYKYNGDKLNDLKHGFGVQTWEDKSQFMGNFEENKAQGPCIFTNKHGSIYKGN